MWKVVALTADGELPRSSAVDLLFSFSSRQAAEEHMKNFAGTAMKMVLVEVKEKPPTT